MREEALRWPPLLLTWTVPSSCLAGTPLALGGFGAVGTAWLAKVSFLFAEAA